MIRNIECVPHASRSATSAVLACPCVEAGLVGRQEQPLARAAQPAVIPSSSWRRYQRERAPRVRRPLTRCRPATQPTRSSSAFHRPANTPPGRSTRRSPASPGPGRTSARPGRPSRRPRRRRAAGSPRPCPRCARDLGQPALRSSASICGSGSTAVTSGCRRPALRLGQLGGELAGARRRGRAVLAAGTARVSPAGARSARAPSRIAADRIVWPVLGVSGRRGAERGRAPGVPRHLRSASGAGPASGSAGVHERRTLAAPRRA